MGCNDVYDLTPEEREHINKEIQRRQESEYLQKRQLATQLMAAVNDVLELEENQGGGDPVSDLLINALDNIVNNWPRR